MMINLNQIKKENDDILSHLKLKDFTFLPALQNEFSFKDAADVRIRVFILSIIVQVSFGLVNERDALKYIENNNLSKFITKEEYVFLTTSSKEDKINETWKSECVWCLLWCLSIDLIIDDPSALGDLNTIKKENYPFIDMNSKAEAFIGNQKMVLRDKTEIIKMLDFYSRLDYICDWYAINNIGHNLNSAVIYERRYALIWLTSNFDWDKIECNSIL